MNVGQSNIGIWVNFRLVATSLIRVCVFQLMASRLTDVVIIYHNIEEAMSAA